MAVLIAISMLFGSLPVSAREKAKLDAVSKEKTLEVTLLMPESEKGTDAVAGTLDYDHTKLELEEVKTGDPKLQEPVFNGDNGKFTTLIKSETIRQSVHAVKFVFKIKSDATGETTVRVSKLEVADAEDAKQTYEDVSVKAVLGDKQKPSEDKDDSSTTDKDNSSTTDKDNSSTADKGDSSTAGKNDSTSSGSANGGEKGKTDTAAGKAGARTGGCHAGLDSRDSSECRSADSSEDTKTKNKIIHRKPGGCSAGCRQPPALSKLTSLFQINVKLVFYFTNFE